MSAESLGLPALITFSTPVRTDHWWHFKRRTSAGLTRWASPRFAADGSAPAPEVLTGRPGAVVVSDASSADPLSSATAVAFHPSGDRVAYVSDSDGSEHLVLRVRWIDAPPQCDRVIADSVSHSLCWGPAGDRDSLYFCRIDATLRPCAVARTAVGDEPSSTVDVAEDVMAEPGIERAVRVSRCATGDRVVVHSSSSISTRVLAIDADRQATEFDAPARSSSRWHVDTITMDTGEVRWIALTDYDSPDRFRVLVTRAAVDAPQPESWITLFDPRDAVVRAMYARGSYALVEQIDSAGEGFVAVYADGTVRDVHRTDTWRGRPARYVLDLAGPPETTTFTVSTAMDPPFVLDVDRQGCAVRRGGMDGQDQPGQDRYERTEIDVPAPDGMNVPVSLVRRSTLGSASAPCVVEVYGAYGVDIGRHFDPAVAQLLEAGIVVAFAHVRGGSERGPGWHALGTGAGKERSITDFVACLDAVARHRWVDHRRVAAWGTSAGGTVVAAAINRAPHAMYAAALDIPFVDPLGTLQNAEAPLALRDRAEWGDPVHDDTVRRAMERYSPLQNACTTRNPIMRVTAGQHDPRAPLADIERWLDRLGQSEALVTHSGGHSGDRAETTQWLIELLQTDESVRRVS